MESALFFIYTKNFYRTPIKSNTPIILHSRIRGIPKQSGTPTQTTMPGSRRASFIIIYLLQIDYFLSSFFAKNI